MGIKERIKRSNSRLGRWIVRCYDRLDRVIQRFLDVCAFLHLSWVACKQRLSRKKTIRVVFLYQYPAAWAKNSLLYEAMVRHPRFDARVLQIPNTDCSKDAPSAADASQAREAWLLPAYDPRSGRWVSLKKMKPDYVFYTRPYNGYLPRRYRSSRVSGYAKVCNIPYGFNLSNSLTETLLNHRFMRDVAVFFADQPESQRYVAASFPVMCRLGLKRALNLGYPALLDMKAAKGEESPYWRKSNDCFKAVWTPRWTSDAAIGGTSFFTYWKSIAHFFEREKGVSLVFRPHPLAIGNWINTGELSRDEAVAYLVRFQHNEKLFYDNQPAYYGTFWTSDVLITDYSSVITEYMLTGKPIILCHQDDSFFNQWMRDIAAVCYRARDWASLEEHINHLRAGIDPLAEKRLALSAVCNRECDAQMLEHMLAALMN